jgi:hypothetical protein
VTRDEKAKLLALAPYGANKNDLRWKKWARVARAMRKRDAAAKIPHLGFRVRAADVRRHRYLRDRGLNHSHTLVKVFISRDAVAA